jgi:hypothetical protein
VTGPKLLAIGFMLALDVLIWLILRAYQRRGVILAFPWNIDRERSPRWFRFNMLVGWLAFWSAIAFTILITVSILTASPDA